MDIFSADLPVDAFQQVPAPIARPTHRRGDRGSGSSRRSRRPSGRCCTPAAACCRRGATAELAALAEALEVPVAHTLMGKGCLREDHPLLLGQTGFWGTPIANDKCRDGRSHRRRRHAARRGELELVGSALHLLDSADAADPHRRRRGRDRPQLSDRARRRRRREAGARRARRRRRAAGRHRDRGRLRERHRARPAGVRRQLGSSVELESVPDAARAHSRASCARPFPKTASSSPTSAGTRTASAQQFPITVPGTFITPSGLATMGFGPAAVLGVKMAHPDRAAVALIGDGGFSTNPSVIATAMEADLPVVWLVMDNAGVRHDRRPRVDALRLELRLHVRALRQAVPRRLRRDGARVRRARRRRSSRPTSSVRRCARRSPRTCRP